MAPPSRYRSRSRSRDGNRRPGQGYDRSYHHNRRDEERGFRDYIASSRRIRQGVESYRSRRDGYNDGRIDQQSSRQHEQKEWRSSRTSNVDTRTPVKRKASPLIIRAPKKGKKAEPVDDHTTDNKTPSKRKTPPLIIRAPKKGKKDDTLDDNITDDEEEIAKKVSLVKLEDENKKLKVTLSNKNDIITKLRKKTMLRQRTIDIKDDLIAKNKTLEKEIEEMTLELEQLKEDKTKGETEGDVKDELKEKLKREKAEHELLKIETKLEKDDLKKKIEKEKKIETEKVLTLKKDNARLRKERDEYKTSAANLKKDVEEMVSKHEALEKASNEATSTLKRRDDQLKKAESDFEDKLSELSIRRSQLVDTEDSENLLINKTFTIHETTSVEDTEYFEEDDTKPPNDSDDDAEDSDIATDGDGEENQKVSDCKNEDSEEQFVLNSDEEFEDANIIIGNTEVKNYLQPKDCIAKDVEVPQHLKNKVFKPTPTSLNNKLVFTAVGTGSIKHQGDKKGCGLFPACKIFWKRDCRIAKVFIITGNHPLVGDEVWSCLHHSQASINGFHLQTQKIWQRHRAGSGSSNQKSISGENSEEIHKKETKAEEKKTEETKVGQAEGKKTDESEAGKTEESNIGKTKESKASKTEEPKTKVTTRRKLSLKKPLIETPPTKERK